MSILDNIDVSEADKERFKHAIPESALQKIIHLKRESDREDAFYSGLRENSHAEARRRQEWVALKTRIEHGYERGPDARTAKADAQVKDCEQKIADSYEATKRIEEEIKNRPPTFSLSKAVEAVLALPRGTMFVPASAKVNQDVNPRDPIVKTQEEIAAEEKKVVAINNALYPKAEVEARCHADIDGRAGQVKIDFTSQARPRRRTRDSAPAPGKTAYPMKYLETGSVLITEIDAAGLFFALHKNELKTLATDQLNELYRSNPLVIPKDKRAERIASVNNRILELSRVEEAWIEVAEAQGLKVLRRPNAHPFAVLGIAIDTSPKPTEDAAPAEEDDDFG